MRCLYRPVNLTKLSRVDSRENPIGFNDDGKKKLEKFSDTSGFSEIYPKKFLIQV